MDETVSEYFDAIFESKKQTSSKLLLNDYFKIQLNINEKMRCILVDWLNDVFRKFKLEKHTFFLAVSIIDRYLQQVNFNIQRSKFQLLGVTCMLIASKYNEIYFPDLKDFKYICDNAYTIDEILKNERQVCITLDHCFPMCTTFYFIEMLIIRYNIIENDKAKLFDFCFVSTMCFKLHCKFSTYILSSSILQIINNKKTEHKYALQEELNEDCTSMIIDYINSLHPTTHQKLAYSLMDKAIIRVKDFLK